MPAIENFCRYIPLMQAILNTSAQRAGLVVLLAAMPTLAYPGSAAAQSERVDSIQVTATRVPGPADLVPANISVIRGEELRARGAIDLASALSLVAGVEAPAGGDTGPAGAVPPFLGLHDIDALPLVVVPGPPGGP